MDLNKDLTIFYVVGGDQQHYDSMFRCMKSIRQSGIDPHFLILEFGKTLTSLGKVKVINMPDVIDFNSGKKAGHIIWKHKYVAALEVETKYGMYVDTDTVLANNNFEDLVTSIKDGIGVVHHFWCPKVADFAVKAVPPGSPGFKKVCEQHSLTGQEDFTTGGLFVFANNEKNKKVFLDILEYHDMLQEAMGRPKDDPEYFPGVTDEVFLVAALKKYDGHIECFNGAANHCSMGESFMPMKLVDGTLHGKNPQDAAYEIVTFLHCDTSRRDPSKEYSGRIKEVIRQRFSLK